MQEVLNTKSGSAVAEAINTRITNIAREVYNKSPYDKSKRGIIEEIVRGLYSVKIDNVIYPNIHALRSAGTLNLGDVVICIIPNNQFSDMYILGAID